MKMITENFKFADIFPEKAAEVAQRLHIKKDEIPFVRKYYTAEKDKTEVKKKERAVISYISTGIKDRDGEKLIPDGVVLDNYTKNPIVPFGHNYKSIPPAKNMWIKKDEKGLIAKTVFAKSKSAEEYYQAYTEDIGGTGPLLNAFSVGFIPLDWTDTEAKALEKDPDLPKRTYNKWELLEYSLVPIPSCPEALTIAVEKGLISKKLLKELEIEVVKDVEDREIEVELDGKESDEKEKESDDNLTKEIEVEMDKEIFNVGVVKKQLVKQEFYESEKDIGKLERWSEHINFDDNTIGVQFGKRKFLVNPDGKIEEITTKPETTENYHRIPVSEGHKDHEIRTITISAKQGIKALYCVDCKKVKTYLFSVDQWTMEEAQTWVNDHKDVLERYEEILVNREEKTVGDITDEIIEVEEKQDKYKCECIKCGHKLTSEKHCKEIKCPKCGGTMRRQARPGPGQPGGGSSPGAVASDVESSEALRADVSDELEETKGDAIEGQQDSTIDIRLKKMDNEIAKHEEAFDKYSNLALELLDNLKAGRVLSRKNRNIVKEAITALNAVLKADAAGTQEDEDSAGTVTERDTEIEIVKDEEPEIKINEADIAKLIKTTLDTVAMEKIEKALKENLDPKKIKESMREIARLEIQRIKGKVE